MASRKRWTISASFLTRRAASLAIVSRTSLQPEIRLLARRSISLAYRETLLLREIRAISFARTLITSSLRLASLRKRELRIRTKFNVLES